MTQLKQPFHILRKDAKHLWPELTLHTVLLIAFAWIVPLGWPPHQPTSFPFQILPAFLHLLLPILWLVIVSRLVHDESLVGDQQFWLTRPYTWTSLLASKLLFLSAFIFLPFLLMQCYLLFHAGLHPLPALPGLLLNLFYLILICFLPFLVLAAVTSTFPRLALSIISGLIYLIVVALLFAYFTSGQTPPPQAAPILATVSTVLVVGILLFQYSKRRSLYARLALIALPLVATSLLFLLPSDALFHNAYPLATGPNAPHISFDPTASQEDQSGGSRITMNNLVMVRLPITLTGVAPADVFNGEAVSYTLDSTTGSPLHYASSWGSARIGQSSIALLVPEETLASLKNQTARLHITLAAEHLLPTPTQSITVADRFALPGNTVCFKLFETGGAICRFAPNVTSMTHYTGEYSTQPCSEQPAAPHQMGFNAFNFGPQILLLDPVLQIALGFANPNTSDANPVGAFLCSGTQLSVTRFPHSQKLRLEFDIPPIPLDHYIAHDRGKSMQMAPQE
jgi:hypothetical protein